MLYNAIFRRTLYYIRSLLENNVFMCQPELVEGPNNRLSITFIPRFDKFSVTPVKLKLFKLPHMP